MSEQEISWKIQDGPSPCGPWVQLKDEKRGLILFRLRLKGGFNLVSRLWRDNALQPFQGSDFLEGVIDTDLGLGWGEDIDVRKKISVSQEETKVKK